MKIKCKPENWISSRNSCWLQARNSQTKVN